VTEFYDGEIEKRQREAAAQHDFELQDHSLYLYGICSECRAEQK
jgi:Fur family ferric uptake transcriptional regulator